MPVPGLSRLSKAFGSTPETWLLLQLAYDLAQARKDQLSFVGVEYIVRYRLSSHAKEEIERRHIPLAVVESILEKPDQVVPERGAVRAYQSRWDLGGKMFLVRVMVDDSLAPAVVVTVYRTSKIEWYWKKP